VRFGKLVPMDEFTIAIALWDGVEELDFAGPYEVLTAWARMSESPISVRTVASSADAVRCSHDLKVVPDSTWDDVGKLDLLVLPGGDTLPLQADESFLERMRTSPGPGR
jgi:putative intracellular protease/amidase